VVTASPRTNVRELSIDERSRKICTTLQAIARSLAPKH
jgi:hypothetical protein